MTAPIFAGFECGRLPWNGHDLLHSTGHLPGGGMERHYAHAIAHGAAGARDGLSWRHNVGARVRAASGLPVMWDLVHFDMPPDPEAHAAACAAALGAGAQAIAVNEPTIHARFQGDGQSRPFVESALRMMRATPELRYASCDALHDRRPETWWATDRLAESGLIELVGINYYPHCGTVPLIDILREARVRYPGMPLAITETGWHVDHPHLPPGERRLEWLTQVQRACEEVGGVDFVCWYPWLDMPCWDMSGEVWPCGWPEAA